MKTYDYSKAKQLIENEKDNLESASLGMHEDWFWTGETIWEDGEYQVNLNDKDLLIGGIGGSSWATPVIQLEYKDGSERMLNCYKGESDKDSSQFLPLGVMSQPVQDNITPIEED